MIYGPNPDDTHDSGPDLMQQIFAMTAGATLERLPVQYEVSIYIEADEITASVKAYGATVADATEIAAFARAIRAIVKEDISE